MELWSLNDTLESVQLYTETLYVTQQILVCLGGGEIFFFTSPKLVLVQS